MTTDPIPPRVDVAFPLAGERVPRDHGYALFGAMCRVLGDLHGAPWLAVHPLAGMPHNDGTLALRRHNLALRLRVVPAEIPRVLPLAGVSLELDGHTLLVGASRLFALAPASKLTARVVTIKGFTEEKPFEEAVRRQLDAHGVAARIEVARRRIVTINGDHVVGFATTLHELSAEHSLVVQHVGVGGRQRMGCGVFVPAGEVRS